MLPSLLQLLGLAILIHLGTARPGLQLARPDWSIYHTSDQIRDAVNEIVQANPSIMNITTRHASANDSSYDADMQVVTVSRGGPASAGHAKLRVLIDFGEHGREIITSEIALRLLHTLASTEELQRALPGEAGEGVVALLEHAELMILPMENVRGRARVEAGELCLRKNGRDVDPNRNWDIHWGFKEKDYDPKEEYPGEEPFSEPEVRIIHALAQEFRPHVWVNVHSGMEALFMPYDHRAAIPDSPEARIQLHICEDLNAAVCDDRCAVGSGGESVGYLAHGTATDYMALRAGIPLAFTWEVYGDTAAHYRDCFRMFNPLTRAGVEAVTSTWSAAVLQLLLMADRHPDVPTLADLLRQDADAGLGPAGGAAQGGDPSLLRAEQQHPTEHGGAGAGAKRKRFHVSHAESFDGRATLDHGVHARHMQAALVLFSLGTVAIILMILSFRGSGARKQHLTGGPQTVHRTSSSFGLR